MSLLLVCVCCVCVCAFCEFSARKASAPLRRRSSAAANVSPEREQGARHPSAKTQSLAEWCRSRRAHLNSTRQSAPKKAGGARRQVAGAASSPTPVSVERRNRDAHADH